MQPGLDILKFSDFPIFNCSDPLVIQVMLPIDDYAEDGRPWVQQVWPLCSFYHIHKPASNTFSEPVYFIQKPYDLK